MERKIRIVLAEDKTLMRKSLIALLNDYSRFEIVGEAGNGKELIDLLKKTDTDIVLLDIEMPVMNGSEALKIIRLRFPEVKVVVLSVHNELYYVKDFLSNGARGFLPKDCLPEELINALESIQDKGFYLEDQVSKELLHESVYGTQTLSKGALSTREVEVLKELCNGCTEKEVAIKLNISRHTVHFHKMNIYSKTKSHNLAGVIKFAHDNGLISKQNI
jgi:two-component system, NarL family, response regulator DegU